MSVKQIGLSGLVVALCSLGGLHAQEVPPGSQAPDVLPLYTPFGSDTAFSDTPRGPATGQNAPLASSIAAAPAGTTPEGVAIDEGSPPIPPPVAIPLGLPRSPYLVYPRSPCCCGPVGHCGGPFGYEVFARTGWAFPVGGGIFNQYSLPAWDVEGGGILYLFNPPSTAAWLGTLSISNINAIAGARNQPITLFRYPVHTLVQSPPTTTGGVASATPQRVEVPEVTVTFTSVNMTFVNMGFGREWWLHGSGDPGQQKCWNWRVGCDFGGRYGSAEVQFAQVQHHTDVVGGMYGAIHSDFEYPFRCGIFVAGMRLEYNYIWTSLLQDQNDGDWSSINLLFNLGVRF